MFNYQNMLILLFFISYSTCLSGGWNDKTQEEISEIESLMNIEDFKILHLSTKLVAGLSYMMAIEYQNHKCYMYFNQIFLKGLMVSKNLGEFENLTEEDEDFMLPKCPENMTSKLIGKDGIMMNTQQLTRDVLFFDEWVQDEDTDLTDKINNLLFLSELQISANNEKMVTEKDLYKYVMLELSGVNESKCLTILTFYEEQPGLSYFSGEEDAVEDDLVSDDFIHKTFELYKGDREVCSPELINGLDHHMVNHYPDENRIEVDLDEIDFKGNQINNSAVQNHEEFILL